MQKSVSRLYRGDRRISHVWTDRLTADVVLASIGAGVLGAVTIAAVVGAITVNGGTLALLSEPDLAVAGLIGAFDALVVAALGSAFNGWGR